MGGVAYTHGRGVGTWDLGLDYRKTYHMLRRRIEAHRRRRAWRSYCYASVLLIQLRNGARVSEAVDAALEFARSGSRKARVRVRKKRREEYRDVVLPEELKPKDLEICVAILEDPKAVQRVKSYAKSKLGINTHSLRYAFVTKLSREGHPPHVIAKLTGHTNLKYLITYTQRKAAEEVLESLRP